jgi:hypothetical protein
MKINFYIKDVLLKLNYFLAWNEYYEMIFIMHIIFWNIWMNFVKLNYQACWLLTSQAIVYMILKCLNTCFTLEIHYSYYVGYKCWIKIHLSCRNELLMHKWIVKFMSYFIKLVSFINELVMISSSYELCHWDL